MQLNFKLLDNNSTINKEILSALVDSVTYYMNDVIAYIKTNLPGVVKNAIISQPEYDSLINGQLKFELGIPDGEAKIIGLLNIWMNNIVYDYKIPKISGNLIISNFSVSMIKIDFDDVIYSEFATVKDAKGYSIPWLEWLLTEGTATLVPEHSVIFGANPRSRTGNAIMRKNKRTSWKVPSQYAGTINDNWITRALDSAEDNIQDVLNKASNV